VGEKNNIPDMIKRLGNLYNIYDFKQKLKYKCYSTKTNYKEVDESFTSKCFCNCSNYKKDLGASKIYNCTKSGMVLDRDINGAKNILLCCL
jgi:putative transposase